MVRRTPFSSNEKNQGVFDLNESQTALLKYLIQRKKEGFPVTKTEDVLQFLRKYWLDNRTRDKYFNDLIKKELIEDKRSEDEKGKFDYHVSLTRLGILAIVKLFHMDYRDEQRFFINNDTIETYLGGSKAAKFYFPERKARVKMLFYTYKDEDKVSIIDDIVLDYCRLPFHLFYSNAINKISSLKNFLVVLDVMIDKEDEIDKNLSRIKKNSSFDDNVKDQLENLINEYLKTGKIRDIVKKIYDSYFSELYAFYILGYAVEDKGSLTFNIRQFREKLEELMVCKNIPDIKLKTSKIHKIMVKLRNQTKNIGEINKKAGDNLFKKIQEHILKNIENIDVSDESKDIIGEFLEEYIIDNYMFLIEGVRDKRVEINHISNLCANIVKFNSKKTEKSKDKAR
ncbi:MAG: hypothetical protein ACFFCS_11230 [Candidatus Hodarchaeota archaeon]